MKITASPEKITWTRVLLDGKLVGGIDPDVDMRATSSQRDRQLYRDAFDVGYRLAADGFWVRKSNGGRLSFDCGNSLGCSDVNCNCWH